MNGVKKYTEFAGHLEWKTGDLTNDEKAAIIDIMKQEMEKRKWLNVHSEPPDDSPGHVTFFTSSKEVGIGAPTSDWGSSFRLLSVEQRKAVKNNECVGFTDRW